MAAEGLTEMLFEMTEEEVVALQKLGQDFPDIAEKVADIHERMARASALLHGYGDPEVRNAISVLAFGMGALQEHGREAQRRYTSKYDEDYAAENGMSLEEYEGIMEKNVDREAYERGLVRYRERTAPSE